LPLALRNRSILLTAVQPSISAIYYKTLNNLTKRCYLLPCWLNESRACPTFLPWAEFLLDHHFP